MDGVVDLVRCYLQEHYQSLIPEFESALGNGQSTDKYQAALGFLGGWVNQDAVNEVVRGAVMQACRNPAKFAGFESVVDDADPDDWWLPDGAEQLGKLLVECSQLFKGPVLTTNFDPLVEVGVRKAGGTPTRTIVDSDGNLSTEAEEMPGAHRVAHLHGYWRGSDTLHSSEQLVSKRDRLTASLRRVLENRLLLVVGYGGWDDVFTRALAELLNDPQSTLDVLWCFGDSEQDLIKARHKELFERVRSAIARNRFRAFGGIDCHRVFETLQTELVGKIEPPALPICPLTGWQAIDAKYLGDLPELDDEELLRYFEGQVPTWRHAASARIPRRSVVEGLVEAICKTGDQDLSSIHVLLGAGGEGKSTTLLQVAADVARQAGWHVLWRPEPGVELEPTEVSQLGPHNQRWLLVTDDGEELVQQMLATLRQAHDSGGRSVHLLVAARDTDWLAAGGVSQPWRNYAPSFIEPTRLRGLTPEDASRLVEAWAVLGTNGLGRLAAAPDKARRVQLVIKAVEQESRTGEGSFFGGMLEARLGRDGLREHLVSLLNRLTAIPIPGSALSLGDALMYVACCHGTGIAGLDGVVLADLLGVDPNRVHRNVVRPLGDEAAAVRSARCIYTRHRKVADALLVVGEQRCGFDLPELWENLIKSVIKCQPLPREWFPKIVHHSPRLFESLPVELTDAVRAETAVAAARGLIAAQPHRLGYNLVDLARTHRATGNPAKGAQTLADSIEEAAQRTTNWAATARQYLYEWSVCEGTAGRPKQNIWLAALSLSDQFAAAPITKKNAWLALSGLGAAFGNVQDKGNPGPFAKARASCAMLGLRTNPPGRTRGYFEKHEREASDAGAGQPPSVRQAVASLCDGVQAARTAVADEQLPAPARETQATFERLAALLI